MFVSRRSKCGHNWKHLSLNRFLFLITILQVHQVLAGSDLLGSTTACAKRWTCSSCTEATTSAACSWLVAEQMCADNAAVAAPSRLVVTDGSSCPKFSVNNSVSLVDDHKVMAVTVTVDDGDTGGGFVGLLANSSVRCQLDNKNCTAAKADGGQISCSCELAKSPRYRIGCRQLTSHVSHLLIVFDGKFLRFDNASDHYLTTYPGVGDCPKIECPHCHWNDGTHAVYYKWCLDDNNTTADRVSFQHCDVRNASNFVRLNTANTQDDEMCSCKPPVVVNSQSESPVTPKLMVQSDQPPGIVDQASNNSSPVNITVDGGQMFGGIASGGTTFPVRGQHFDGLRNVKACVSNKHFCGRCEVRNDTLMVCQSPKMLNDSLNATSIRPMHLYTKNSTGSSLKLNPSPVGYRLYQDPVFADFVVDGCCNVTVNGLRLDQGYAAEDLSISPVAVNSSSRCLVTSVDSSQIICKLSSSSQLGSPPKQINVMLGNIINVVNPSKQKSSYFKRSSAVNFWPGAIITIGAYVSFIVVLCIALVFFKSSKDYDLLHLHGRQQLAEMRPLDERNFNDHDYNDDTEEMLSARDEPH